MEDEQGTADISIGIHLRHQSLLVLARWISPVLYS
jgi:hypothetical protein